MRRLLASWMYGPHASSIRPERTPSPGAARPGRNHNFWRAESKTLARCRAARSASPPAPCAPPSGRSPRRAKGRGLPPPLGPLAPLSPRLPRGSQPGGRGRVCERLHRAPIVRLKRAARSLARPLVKVPPAGPGARTQPALNPSAAPEAAGPPRCRGGPPRRSRGEPGASARELSTRSTTIERVFRRLQGCRRLCSRCEQLDVLFLGFIGFPLIIDALREW